MLAVIGLALLAVQPMAAAVDYEEYARLRDHAIELFEAVQAEEVPDSLREEAVAAYLAVIDWLDAFFADPAFSDLPADQQAGAYSDRYRWEYNLASQLLALDRCEEAHDSIRRLLDSAISDPELRPHLTEAYEEAVACMARPRTATLTIECEPADARVLVDGALVGLANAALEVELGAHTVTLQEDGYESAVLDITAETEGQAIQLGPVSLVPLLSASPREGKLPTWYEWTLWGAGAAGLTTGVILYLDARNQEDVLDDPGPGMIVSDPDRERDEIDAQDRFAYVVGGVGLASAIAGTLLYVLRDGSEAGEDGQGNDEDAVSWGTAGTGGAGARAWVRLRF
jgi:hypothetical protein